MVYIDKKHRRSIALVFCICVTIVFATLLITKEQDFSRPCRILAINQWSITAEEWNPHYWQGGLIKIVIPVTNCEAEVGDFINLRGEFVNNEGVVLDRYPEQTDNVYTVTSIDEAEDLWWVVQGPLTYKAGQGTASLPIINDNIQVGDMINDEGQKVDMFGNLA